jgi:Cu/Ag efflux protein CusF
MNALLTTTLIALTFALAAPAMAQTDHSMHGMPAAKPVAAAKPATATADAAMGDGLVKKVDKAKGTVTLAHGALPNVLPPLCFDLATTPWPVAVVDAIVAINVLHYSPWETTPALFAGAAEVLPAGGVVVCYGPYRRGGAHTAPSNADFDEWLRSVDPRFAVRDLEAVDAEAQRRGFALEEVVDMPANNFTLVLRRRA